MFAIRIAISKKRIVLHHLNALFMTVRQNMVILMHCKTVYIA